MGSTMKLLIHNQVVRRIFAATPLCDWHRCFLLVALVLIGMGSSFSYAEDTALVLRGNVPAMEEVLDGMKSDLDGEITFVDHAYTKKMTVEDLGALIKKTDPNMIILLGNKSINLYKKYFAKTPPTKEIPTLLVAGLFVDYIKGLGTTSAIRYEIPAVTSILTLRVVTEKPIKKVGVIYRKWMKDFVETNKRYCEAEGIELVAMEIGNKEKNFASVVKKKLKALKKAKVDALWVLNDNALLNPTVIVKGWQAGLENSKLPVIVGVEKLVASQFNFGTFAVVPDHYPLGVQAAGLIADFLDDDWEVSGSHSEQPISVRKILNRALSKKNKIGIKVEGLKEIDAVLE